MVFAMNAGCYGSREKLLARLKADLQAAIAVELATIPIYLYSYYSINRTVMSGKELTDTARFSNEAGAVVMSAAVEEMLHMPLSSNIYFALTGTPPKLYTNAPPPTQHCCHIIIRLAHLALKAALIPIFHLKG